MKNINVSFHVAFFVSIAGTLLSSFPVYAIDCAKASTNTDKLICSDQELLKLDGELNVAYKKALDIDEAPEVLKKDQRLWLIQRDSKSSITELNKFYHDRIILLNIIALQNSPPPKLRTIPKYPDIWGFTPDPAKYKGIINGVLLPDGDVGIALIGKNDQTRYKRLFFDRPLSLEDQYRIRFNVGVFKLTTTLSDGRTIQAVGGSDWTPRTGCYTGPSTYVEIYGDENANTANNTHLEKSFLYVLNKPRRFNQGDICENTPKHFELRVVALDYFNYMALPDGTFLVVSMGGGDEHIDFILRFDHRFETKSKILKGRLFVVSTEVLNNWLKSESGKSFGEMQRDLYHWLKREE